MSISSRSLLISVLRETRQVQRVARSSPVTARDEAFTVHGRSDVESRQRDGNLAECNRVELALDAALAARLRLDRPMRKLDLDCRNSGRRMTKDAEHGDDGVDFDAVLRRH
jgi:hypothetical protein